MSSSVLRLRSVPLFAFLLGLLAAPSASAQNGAWSSLPPMPTARADAAGGVIGGRLHVVGGVVSACGRTGAMEIFDPATNTWTSGAPMPTPRGGFDAAVVQGVLYAAGGLVTCGASNLSLVEAYDSATHAWSMKAPMPTARRFHRMAVVDDIVYALGGFTSNAVATNEAYDPALNAWSIRAPMPTARYAPAVAASNGLLYVIGGFGNSGVVHAVEVYDPATDTWSVRSPLPMHQGWTRAVSLNGFIYVIGGFEYPAGIITGRVQAYDTVHDVWSTVAAMPTKRSDKAMGVIDGVIYVAGGNQPSFPNNLRVLESFEPSFPPSADAGLDLTVPEHAFVVLDGSASHDPDGDPLAFEWTQIAGPLVTLSNPASPVTSFLAPAVAAGGATLTFQLVVRDGLAASAPDLVNVSVTNVNRRPRAFAGDDQTVREGTPVTLDGTSSSDDDDDALAYAWMQVEGPPVALSGAGSAVAAFTAPQVGVWGAQLRFRLEVSDGIDMESDEVLVLVENFNQVPIARAGEDQTHFEGSPVTLDGGGSSDPDLDPITYAWMQVSGPAVLLSDPSSASPTFTAPEVSPAGAVLVFELLVDDGLASSPPDSVSVAVLDVNAPPLCSSAKPTQAQLWPPNHKLVPIQITGVSDPENDAISITVTSVTQDEPTSGLGDGDTGPDAVLQGSTVLLRAERSGSGNGRVYTVRFVASDGQGGTCEGSVKISVPHHLGQGGAAVDSGVVYSSN